MVHNYLFPPYRYTIITADVGGVYTTTTSEVAGAASTVTAWVGNQTS